MRRVVGAVVGAALVLTACSSGDDPTAESSTSTTVRSTTDRSTAPPPDDGIYTEVTTIDCSELLETDEIEEALAVWDRPNGEQGTIFQGANEVCTDWVVSDERVFVLIEPGDPDDFEPSGRVLGVTGEPVGDVGDDARWFGGSEANGGGTAGVLSVRKDTPVGVLYFRIGLGRPDLTTGEQLAVATKLATRALPRFPGLEALAPVVPLVNLCELVSDAEADAVLAGYRDRHPATRDDVFVIGSSAPVDLRDFGDVTCLKLILAEIYVEIQQGSSDDFEPGAEFEGVAGEPVSGVGDEAVWYGDIPFQGRFTAPHEQGILSIRTADAFFRIVLGLPDTGSADQLDIARGLASNALTRIPGYAPTQEPLEIVIESEPFDRSGLSYVDNLLAKEASDEWSLGEGLVSTLQLFVGEVDATGVLRFGSVVDDSGGGILQMALQYLENGGEQSARAEIERLVEILLPDLEPTTGGDAEALSRSVRVSMVRVADSDLVCAKPWGPDEPYFCRGPVAEEFFGDKYNLVFPDADEWEGWKRGQPEDGEDPGVPDSPIQGAIARSVLVLEFMPGEMPPIEVVLGKEDASSFAYFNGGICVLILNKGVQKLLAIDQDLAGQAVAVGMADCYSQHNFGSAELESLWWGHGLNWYVSDVVYPGASLEIFLLSIPHQLSEQELDNTLLDRTFTNMAFYEYLDAAIGEEGIFAFTSTVASGSEYEGMDGLLHGFAKALSDGVIFDQGGAHEYVPPAGSLSLSNPMTVRAVVPKLGTQRIQVSVDGAEYACLEYPDAGNSDIFVSYRDGPLGGGGSWVSDLPTAIQGEGVFVFTTTEETQGFRIKVVDTGENEDCEDEDESVDGPTPSPDPSCSFCEPSRFFRQKG